ncbi:hypothetical protein J437_LFUL003905 [Ladona fulva]|uniref:Uncharacterized protein n=1 Tax=Ladona fulva TaxID=123851 RepID=A0A8K0K5S4_LADFU|nr:hypothetical protein J437_LFUL003905 [Ladona fulva]
MNIRRSYFELVERDSENVSSAWKVLSILFYLGSVVSGITCSCAFAYFLDTVGGNCILFSSLTFNSSVTVNTTIIAFDAANSEWGKSISCTFCLCVPVVSILFGLSWATFFLMCGKGGNTHRGYLHG